MAWLPLISAILYFAAFPPLGASVLAWVALVPWILYLERGRRPVWMSFVCAWLWGSLCMQWLANAVWFTPPIIGLYFGLTGLAFALAYRWLRDVGVPIALAAAVAWTPCEWMREWLLTGLPFFFLGHTQSDWLAVIQVADLGGVPLVSFVLVFVNGTVAAAYVTEPRRRWRWPAVAAVLVAVVFGYGVWRLETLEGREAITVGVIQPNIPQELKWEPEMRALHHARNMEMTQAIVDAGAVDLILWPESGFLAPVLVDEGGSPLQEVRLHTTGEIGQVTGAREAITYVRQAGTPILYGVSVWELRHGREPDDRPQSYRPFNSALLVAPGVGLAARYDKAHLVPFGEYVPLAGVFPFLEGWVKAWTELETIWGFEAGERWEPLPVADCRIGPLVCFEVMFSSPSREWAARGADVLVNLSNEGWYGDSAELDQMLAIARFRAVETRRGLVRATNTGISAIIDPSGRTSAVIEDSQGDRRSVSGTLSGPARTTSERTVYVRVGNLFATACAAALLGALACRGGKWAGRFRRKAKE